MTEVTITKLGLHGDGVADGPVYVPRSLPGEIVSGHIQGQTLADPKIVEPSPRRVAAPCRHFKSCGGCQLQHADDAFVAEWKNEIVRNALSARGLETVFRPIVTSPAHSRRRAGFAARRTKKGAMAGFHGRGSDVIVSIPDCQLVDPSLRAALPVVEELAVVGASRKSTISVQVTQSQTGLDVVVSDGKPLDGSLRQQLAALCERYGLARLSWEDEVIAMREPPSHAFNGIEVTPPPGAFLQATKEGETALTKAVLEIVSDARRVLDLFAGCGTFALPTAKFAEVHAVEGDAAMLAALDRGWRHADGLKKVTTETRDLFRRPLMSDELAKADALIIDPPRAGAEAQVAQIVSANIPKIAFVSCNPVTFARDAEALVQSGYALDWLQVVDQFRWSAHVELVASFSASHMP